MRLTPTRRPRASATSSSSTIRKTSCAQQTQDYNPCVTTTPLPQPAKKNWFARHRVLTVVGVLGILITIASAAGCYLIFSLIASSTPAKLAVDRAQTNPVVLQRLGTPLKESWFVTGSIEVANDSGHAELNIPVTGPKGSGKIYLLAAKRFGKWKFIDLEILIAGTDQPLDLLKSPIEEQ